MYQSKLLYSCVCRYIIRSFGTVSTYKNTIVDLISTSHPITRRLLTKSIHSYSFSRGATFCIQVHDVINNAINLLNVRNEATFENCRALTSLILSEEIKNTKRETGSATTNHESLSDIRQKSAQLPDPADTSSARCTRLCTFAQDSIQSITFRSLGLF